MQTIAFHWPLVPASRQAKRARVDGGTESQETGKAFSSDMRLALQGAPKLAILAASLRLLEWARRGDGAECRRN